MKAILISTKPRHCTNIAKGIKKIEVRKSKPKLETPFKCYIYMTKSEDGCYSDWEYPKRQKVIGEFICDSIDTLLESDTRKKWKEAAKASCLTFQQLNEYSGTDEKTLYLWHISNLVIYDNSKKINEFLVEDIVAIKKCEFRRRVAHNPILTNGGKLKGSCLCHKYAETNWCTKCITKKLTRPPQSWCYVKELNK